MRVLVAMSGGVDSSVAAAVLLEQGHDVVGVTMKLWGGPSDTGCCSVSDVDDARRCADRLGIEHHVFSFGDEFVARVVQPYVAAHAAGLTPNPCIECNRHIKFDRLVRRSVALGFDAVATGHHARLVERPDGTFRVARGADVGKDQSYVLYMLDQDVMARTRLPIGAMTKDEVRSRAARLGLANARKPDSQDVCFITRGGRQSFLADRMPLREGRVLDTAGDQVGVVDAVELVTVGQRRGLNLAGSPAPRYVLDVDVEAATVVVGPADRLLVSVTEVAEVTWANTPVTGPVMVQASAHGSPATATLERVTTDPVEASGRSAEVETGPRSGPLVGRSRVRVRWDEPRRRVAPGQSIVFYDGDEVVGGGIVVDDPRSPGQHRGSADAMGSVGRG